MKMAVPKEVKAVSGIAAFAFLLLTTGTALAQDVSQHSLPSKTISVMEESGLPFESPGMGSLEEKNKQLQEAEQRLLKKLSTTDAPAQPPVAQSVKAQGQSEAGAPVAPEAVNALTEKPAPADKKAPVSPLNKLQSDNESLLKKLREKDARIDGLQRELEEARNRLILAETEVERLSSQLDARNRSSLSRLVAPANSDRSAQKSQAATAPRPQTARVQAPAIEESDMQVVTVVADKAHLRAGPGEDNSPIMDVTRGTRLTVETRNGNWLRVNTPTGTRAWISGDVVEFGAGKSSSALRIRSYDASAEEEAFKLLNRSGSR